MSAPCAIICTAFSSSERITRAGAPTTRLLSGNVLPSVTTAPAPTIPFVPIRAPLRRIAPMPIRLPSPTAQPCSTTLCPITQPRPIVSGKPGSVCNVALSWIWERSPTSIHSLSPRNTAPHHTLASDLRRTRPITTAVSAIQYCPSAGNSGRSPASSNIGMVALLKADTCHVASALASREAGCRLGQAQTDRRDGNAEIVQWQRGRWFPTARIIFNPDYQRHHPRHRLARKPEKARVLEEDRLSADRHR